MHAGFTALVADLSIGLSYIVAYQSIGTSIGNSKKIWSNINCILDKKKHSSINTTIKLDGIQVAEPETIANAFNSYFKSIPIMLSDNINNNLTTFESYLDDQIPESDNFRQTSIHEITKII